VAAGNKPARAQTEARRFLKRGAPRFFAQLALASGRSRSGTERWLSEAGRSRSDTERSRSEAGRSRSDTERSRSVAGRSRSDAGRSRSEAGRSRSDTERSRSEAGRSRSVAKHSCSDPKHFCSGTERSRSDTKATAFTFHAGAPEGAGVNKTRRFLKREAPRFLRGEQDGARLLVLSTATML
jgi:hypothetical protein